MRWTTRDIRQMKGRDKIPMLTCYDYTMAKLLDQAGVPLYLVGDSLGNVVLGYETTVPVTLQHMIHHASAVMRAKPKALVVVDMPFLSFQISASRALESAGRIVKESGADAVKLEGGERTAPAIRRIVEAGIPVVGHLGLTPQSVLALGGYPLQGKGADGDRLLEEAKILEEAGCFLLVLEKVPSELAARVTKELSIPTIGIGAGGGCDGQVLVINDLLGLDPDFAPRFVKRFADVGTTIVKAAATYCAEVRQGKFPAVEHEYRDTSRKTTSSTIYGSPMDAETKTGKTKPKSKSSKAGRTTKTGSAKTRGSKKTTRRKTTGRGNKS